MRIEIINGPNLNFLGVRQPEIYGSKGFIDYLAELESLFPAISFVYSQSNIEGELVSTIQKAGRECQGIIINPGGYSHTSVAIADAIAAVSVPVIEVHISNLLSREEFRHTSLTGRYCTGTIMGLGLDGYRLAVEAIMKRVNK
ncbi:MAG: 3-dehydroquinate dehydratase [Bacteroidales bacterium]|jgi:3-dehydroquinate dehydratase-2|nr:3-dehydroquinate dehydratase [Bacteroidales bacterium]